MRPKRIAEIVGHFFPYPQQHYDHRNKRKPLKKHIYLHDFLEALFQKFGHLILLADANYSTQKVISWFKSKGWDFVMRINPNQKKLLEPLQRKFDENPDLISTNQWFYREEFGGWVRVLAFRRYWPDANGKIKEKRYFIITNLDWDARAIWRFYRLRWTLENTFKCLPILDRMPGLDPKLIAGLFAMVFHVMAPICYQSRSSSRTIAKLLQLNLEI
ncbi:MAG: transposase, partial [Candidatus Heimdallarchaeota archaeon]